MKKGKNITLINAIANVFCNFTTILSGFIIPRLILLKFGSDVNGLISSFNQFFGYISLVEGGINSVVMANLYRPLAEKNYKSISSIVKITQKFYNKLSLIFVVYTLLISIIYPVVFKTGFSYTYVSTLGLILGLALFIQYNFALSLRILLNADKKVYVVSFTQILITVINVIAFIILINVFPSIHFIKLVSSLIFILQPIIYNKIVNKYFELDKDVDVDKNILKSRWDGFAISLANFVHSNTDVVILTTFTNLATVSVYSVYTLVTKGMSQLVRAFASGIAPSMGNLYVQVDNKELNNKFELYEFSNFLLTFFTFSIGGLLITPFVKIFTKGVEDANYYQPIFGILIILSEACYCLREPYLNMAFAANKFKDIRKHAYIEAIINITLSLILVNKLGLIGIAIGTLVAIIYRTVFQIIFLKYNVLYREYKHSVYKFIIFAFFTIIAYFICIIFLQIKKLTILSWIGHAVCYCIIFAIIYSIMIILFFKKDYIYIQNKIKNKIKK